MPPRGVGHEQRDHQGVGVTDQTAARTKHDDLARTGVGAEADLGVKEGGMLLFRADLAAARGDRDHTAGMLAARIVGDFEIMLELGLVGGDEQGEHTAQAASPRSSCSSSIFAEISRVSVSCRVMITASSNGVHRGRAFQRPPPAPTCRNDTAAAGRASTRTPRSGRGSSTKG